MEVTKAWTTDIGPPRQRRFVLIFGRPYDQTGTRSIGGYMADGCVWQCDHFFNIFINSL
jgi:hypothetical protein